MNKDEMAKALQTGEFAEPIEAWAPRTAAILITLTLHAPQLLTADPEKVLDVLRQVVAKMPVEVLIAATMGLVEVNKIASTPGMTPELYEAMQEIYKDVDPGS